MDYTSFNEDVKFIFDQLEKFIKEDFFHTRSKDKFIFLRYQYIAKLLNLNENDKVELLKEQTLIIRLYTSNVKEGKIFNRGIRLQALKAVEKKVKYSTERCELEGQTGAIVINAFFVGFVVVLWQIFSPYFTGEKFPSFAFSFVLISFFSPLLLKLSQNVFLTHR